MGLREKTLLIVGLTFLVLIASLFVSSRYVILGGFESLEEGDVQMNVKRFESELNTVNRELERTVGDWACWDATYQFINDKNGHYIDENLTLDALQNINVNFMIFINKYGKMVHGAFQGISDVPGSRVKSVTDDVLFESITQKILSSQKLINLDMTRDRSHGFISISGKPIFLSSRSIIKSDYSGPVNGTLVIGRMFDANEVNRIAGILHLDIEVLPCEDDYVPGDMMEMLSGTGGDKSIPVKPIDKEFVSGYTMARDESGQPAFIGRVTVPRSVYKHGLKTERYYTLSTLAIGIVFTFVLLLLLNNTIINRLRLLSSWVYKIGKSGNIVKLRESSHRDEIGSLTDSINTMLSELEETRRQLMEASYKTGLAEMASGTLHNISNAINPILVQSVILRDNILNLPFDHFEAARRELQDDSVTDSRKRDLVHMMSEGNASLLTILQKNADELTSVIERVAHIEAILESSRDFANINNLQEDVFVEKLVNDATKYFRKDNSNHLAISIDPGMKDLKPLRGPYLLIRQVLDNVLVNAAEAIGKMRNGDGKIFVRAYPDLLNGNEAIHMEISDNGMGISPDTINKIFQKHFTTKDKKASGLGLHWCSNTLLAMNGKIYAESDGLEKGALFHILIPSGC